MRELRGSNAELLVQLRELRSKNNWNMALRLSSGENAELVASLAMNGDIDMEEIRYQQQLWEHRHCHDGNCIHQEREEFTYEQLLDLGERIGNVQVGLSHTEIAALPALFIEEGDCSICQHPIHRENTTQLPCAHFYHTECIGPWLSNKKTCPECLEPVKD